MNAAALTGRLWHASCQSGFRHGDATMPTPRRSRVISAKTPHAFEPQKEHRGVPRDADLQETLPGYYADDGSFVTLPARPRTTPQPKWRTE